MTDENKQGGVRMSLENQFWKDLKESEVESPEMKNTISYDPE